MTSGRGEPTGYEWEESVPTESAPLALPDRGAPRDSALGAGPADEPDPVGPYGAPTFTYDPPEDDDEGPEPRVGPPLTVIVAIVALVSSALVLSVALMVTGVTRLVGPDPAPPSAGATQDPPPTPRATSSPTPTAPAQERTPGVVSDSSGREVTDGTGRYDDPAVVGEHTVSWEIWTGGTLDVTPLEVDLDASVPRAQGQDVLQDGFRLVLVTYEAAYDGPGRFAPVEELWLTGETDLTYFPDVGEGLVPDPMRGVEPLAAGESARFRSAFLVPEGELDSFRLALETFTGETLYFAT